MTNPTQHDENANDHERLTDLLADLMHFCRAQATAEDCPMDFQRALLMAEIHFNDEVAEEERA